MAPMKETKGSNLSRAELACAIASGLMIAVGIVFAPALGLGLILGASGAIEIHQREVFG